MVLTPSLSRLRRVAPSTTLVAEHEGKDIGCDLLPLCPMADAMGSHAAASAAGAAAVVGAAAMAAAAVPLPAEDPWVRADPWRGDGHPAGGHDGTTSGRTEKGSTSADASIDRALRKGKGKGGKQKSSEAEKMTPVPLQTTGNELPPNETPPTSPQTSQPLVIFNSPDMVGPCGMPMSFGPSCMSGSGAPPGFSPMSMQHVSTCLHTRCTTWSMRTT